MIFNIVGTLVGVMILGAGVFYLIKEKNDAESRKIYGITTVAGAVIVLFMIIKIIVGF